MLREKPRPGRYTRLTREATTAVPLSPAAKTAHGLYSQASQAGKPADKVGRLHATFLVEKALCHLEELGRAKGPISTTDAARLHARVDEQVALTRAQDGSCRD